MRNPGGYGQIICDGSPSRAVAFDEFGRVVAQETDTFTCGHCNKVVFVPTRADPANIGGMCKQCMSLVCPICVNVGNCTPLEKKIQEMERRAATLRSYV